MLRRESELLLLSARTSLDPAAGSRLQALAGQDLDWQSLLAQADLHGVAPLVCWQLDTLCSAAVPEAVLRQFRDRFRETSVRSIRLAGKLLELLGLLEAQGIAAVPFKGPTLALAAYQNLAFRSFFDLDLLLRPRDVPVAGKLLLERGYQPEYRLNDAQEAAHIRFQFERVFSRRDTGLMVELQWRVAPRYFSVPLDPETLWDRLQPVTLGSRQVPTLSPEDLLLILCVHGARNLWERLGLVCDVAELVRSHQALDWSRVTRLAAELGSSRMLLLGLFLAQDLMAAPLPVEIRRAIEADPQVKPLAAWVSHRLFEDPRRPCGMLESSRRQVRMRERRRDRALHWLRLAFTPNVADWRFLALPPSLTSLYYVLRPLRLAATYGLRPLRARYSQQK